MATCRVTLDGIFWDFTAQDVSSLETAEDFSLAIGSVCLAAAAKFIGDPLTLSIVETVIAGIQATIAIHRAEFLANNKGNGVEVNLPNWAIALGLFGALFMRPLTPEEEQKSLAAWPIIGSYCLFFYRDNNQNGTATWPTAP